MFDKYLFWIRYFRKVSNEGGGDNLKRKKLDMAIFSLNIKNSYGNGVLV